MIAISNDATHAPTGRKCNYPKMFRVLGDTLAPNAYSVFTAARASASCLPIALTFAALTRVAFGTSLQPLRQSSDVPKSL